MYKHYYVNRNAQTTGEHEVHAEGCSFMPALLNCQYLGYFDSPAKAVEEARKYYFDVDGCYYCCYPVHTK